LCDTRELGKLRSESGSLDAATRLPRGQGREYERERERREGGKRKGREKRRERGERSPRRAKPEPIRARSLFLPPPSSPPFSISRRIEVPSIHSFALVLGRALACTTYRASLLISIYSWMENRLHSTSNRLSDIGFRYWVSRNHRSPPAKERSFFLLAERRFFGWLSYLPARNSTEAVLVASCCWVDALFDRLDTQIRKTYILRVLSRCPFLSHGEEVRGEFARQSCRSASHSREADSFITDPLSRNYVVYSAVSGSAGAFFFACSI